MLLYGRESAQLIHESGIPVVIGTWVPACIGMVPALAGRRCSVGVAISAWLTGGGRSSASSSSSAPAAPTTPVLRAASLLGSTPRWLVLLLGCDDGGCGDRGDGGRHKLDREGVAAGGVGLSMVWQTLLDEGNDKIRKMCDSLLAESAVCHSELREHWREVFIIQSVGLESL